ncbi:hypothetical protein B0H14DRAFT_2558381 [Mycena olivaceomarginata]|nr:hypothetical protein B0H14DRAFT_2558381 [Mycena olivaceomarginata]
MPEFGTSKLCHYRVSRQHGDAQVIFLECSSGLTNHDWGANHHAPHAVEFDVHIPTASEPSVTEFNVNIPPTPSTMDVIDPAFNSTFAFMSNFEFNTILSDVEHLNTVFAADNILPMFDPGFLDCGGSAGFGTSVPDSGSMFGKPANDFMDLYGLPTPPSNPIGTSDFFPFAPSDPLPFRANPPTAEEPASSAPKSCRGPRCEVDEANIMISMHSWVPGTRKQVVDEAPILNRLPKKGKGRQGMP